MTLEGAHTLLDTESLASHQTAPPGGGLGGVGIKPIPLLAAFLAAAVSAGFVGGLLGTHISTPHFPPPQGFPEIRSLQDEQGQDTIDGGRLRKCVRQKPRTFDELKVCVYSKEEEKVDLLIDCFSKQLEDEDPLYDGKGKDPKLRAFVICAGKSGVEKGVFKPRIGPISSYRLKQCIQRPSVEKPLNTMEEMRRCATDPIWRCMEREDLTSFYQCLEEDKEAGESAMNYLEYGGELDIAPGKSCQSLITRDMTPEKCLFEIAQLVRRKDKRDDEAHCSNAIHNYAESFNASEASANNEGKYAQWAYLCGIDGPMLWRRKLEHLLSRASYYKNDQDWRRGKLDEEPHCKGRLCGNWIPEYP